MTLEYSELLKQTNCMVLFLTFFPIHFIFTFEKWEVEENTLLKEVCEYFFFFFRAVIQVPVRHYEFQKKVQLSVSSS